MSNYIVIAIINLQIKTQIIKIGNSQGIRIPKTLLDKSGLKGKVELEVKNGLLIVSQIKKARDTWDESFKKMAVKKDDILLDRASIQTSTKWDNKEWVW